MPIEFRCSGCNKLLRTGDDTAGGQAKCPECGTLTTIPGPGLTPLAGEPAPPHGPWDEAVDPPPPGIWREPAAPPPPPPPPPPGESPFGYAGSEPGDSLNPYASPAGDVAALAPAGDMARAYARERVATPATGLLVTGWIGLVVQLLVLGFYLVSIAAGGMGPPEVFISSSGSIIQLVLSVVVIFGATRMKRLENYGLSMAAAIIGLVPCFSPCCLLGMPFGIWALVVLNDPAVKTSFQ